MPSKAVRQKNFERNSRIIREFCKKYDLDLVELNDGFQMRIEDLLDLYPVRARWHNLTTQERGDWNGYEDLRRLMLEALPLVKPFGSPKELPPTTQTIRLSPNKMFYVKPKWYQWRKRKFYRNLLKTK